MGIGIYSLLKYKYYQQEKLSNHDLYHVYAQGLTQKNGDVGHGQYITFYGMVTQRTLVCPNLLRHRHNINTKVLCGILPLEIDLLCFAFVLSWVGLTQA